jgi:hypothetical protein
MRIFLEKIGSGENDDAVVENLECGCVLQSCSPAVARCTSATNQAPVMIGFSAFGGTLAAGKTRLGLQQ